MKYQYNISIFGVKLESEININIKDTGKTYQLTKLYVHRLRFKIKSKNVPYFEDCAKCFDNILNKGTKYMNTQQEL